VEHLKWIYVVVLWLACEGVCPNLLKADTGRNISLEEEMTQARAFFFEGRREEASALLRSLVSRGTKDSDAYLYLGVIERGKSDLTQAINFFETGLRFHPNHIPLLQELATTYAWAGKLTMAVSTYDQVLALEPNNRAAIMGRARVESWRGHIPEALTVFNWLLSENPDDLEAMKGLAFCLRARGDYQQAAAILRKVLVRAPADSEALDGQKAVEEAIRAKRAMQPTRLDRARDHVAKHETQKAAAILRELAREKKTDPDIYLLLGLQAREQQRLKQAEYWFRQGLAMNPDALGLRLELATTFAWAHQLKAAQQQYEAILTRAPRHRQAQLGRARVLAWQGAYDEALEIYRALLAADSSDLDALRGAAFAFRADLDYEMARTYYRRVLSRVPEDHESLEGMAEMNAVKRFEIGGALGAIKFSKSDPSLAAFADLSAAYDAVWTFRCRYESNVPTSSTGNAAIDNVGSHGVTATATARLSEDWVVEGGYGIRLGVNEQAVHRIQGRMSASLGKELVLLTGVRPGVAHDGSLEALVDAGLQRVFGPSFWAMMQLFASDRQGEKASLTAVATVWWQFVAGWAMRVSGGTGTVADTLTLSASASLAVDLTSSWSLNPSYEYLHGLADRHAGFLQVRYRF